MNDQSCGQRQEAQGPVTALARAAPAGRGQLYRRWLFAAGLILLLGAGLGWWALGARPAVSFMTVPVDRGAVTRVVSATGTVNPTLTVTVGTYVSGVVRDVLCDFNTRVTKGQVCAHIDPAPFRTAVDQAQANLDAARAQLEKDQATLAYARLNADRSARLARQEAASQDAADQALSLHAEALAQIHLDQATIAQREAALDAAKINLAYTDIVSPVDGTVVSRNVTAGQTVAASLQTPTLFLIAQDLASMEVDNNVSESDIGAVKVGQRAEFSVDAYPGRSFEGTVSVVRQSPQSVQNVVTYAVVVNLSNADLALMPGMTASTRIIVEARDDALRVPSQALRYRPTTGSGAALSLDGNQRSPANPAPATGGAEGQVFVLRGALAVAVPVRTGLDDGSFTEILEGAIAPGDPVIIGETRAQTGTSALASGPRFRL